MASLPKRKQPSERRTSRLVWLLTAHLVSSYFIFIQAQNRDFEIIATPRFPTEGQDVKFTPEKPPKATEYCLWSRGENDTYQQIVRYYPSNNTLETLLGYHSGHMPLQDCVLVIKNVSYLDMAIYGLLVKLPKKTMFGEVFLTVTTEREPSKKKALSTGIVMAIALAALVGLMLIVGLVAFQMKGTPFRSGTTQAARDSLAQDTSANKEGNQAVAGSQNPDAEGNKM